MAGVRGENFPGRTRNTPEDEADRGDKIALVRKIIRTVLNRTIFATGGLIGGGNLNTGDITIKMPVLITAQTVPLAKITPGGTDGSIDFDQYGRATSITPPT